MYTKKTLEYFRNPKNVGRIKNPDGLGIAGNLICGDLMYLYIKIGKNKKGEEIIKDIKFETFGCIAAIATSSIITEIAKGKKLEEAVKISKQEIVDSLGGLPPIKIHCSVLATDALAEAVYNYLSKNKKPIPEELAKRHERIQKEKEIIKEKYKDWVDMEKKMLEK
jgi:nitrogen fixation NifU-like protein